MERVVNVIPTSNNSLLFSPPKPKPKPKPEPIRRLRITCSTLRPDPWTQNEGDPTQPKPRSKNPKNPLSDDNARRIIKGRAKYLSVLRRNQGPQVQTPRWIKRSPQQMVQYLNDDRHGRLYGSHVVAAISRVRSLPLRRCGEEEEDDLRLEMASFVGKLSFREMCVVLKEQKNWKMARGFFSWMKLQFSYRPSVVAYTILLRVYGQVGKIKLAEDTFLEMLQAGCLPDQVACGTMLCTYARWGRHDAMLPFFSAVADRQVPLSLSVFNFMLSSLQKKSLHRHVIHLWAHMLHQKVVPDTFTYTVVIGSFYREARFEEALEVFDELRSVGLVPEEVTYSQLISLTVKNGDWDRALTIYHDMRDQKIVPSNYTCASLLTLYYKTEDYSKALALFEEMARRKISADEVIYGLVIRIYGKLGLYNEARMAFDETEQLGMLGDEKTYLAMAQVHLKSGDFEKALEVVHLMKSKNILPSRFAYIVLLQCYVAKKDQSSAEETFRALSETGVADAGSCNDMLRLYLGLDLLENARDFITRIRKDRVVFDEELWKTVVRVYTKKGMLKDVRRLIEEMGTASESFKNSKFIQTISRTICQSREENQLDLKLMVSDQPDPAALGFVIDMYIADRNVNETERVVGELLRVSGGVSVASRLVNNFIREGDAFKAETLVKQLLKLGCRLDDAIVASLINLYGKQRKLKKAEQVYLTFADSPDSERSLCKSMIDVYVKGGKEDEAYSLYTKLTSEAGQSLDAVSISIVVNSLSNNGKHQEAEIIIRKSLDDQVKLDAVAYNTFIKAMLDAGRLHFASSIYEHMLSVDVTPSIQTCNTMISVYGRGRKLDKATEMFNSARDWGLSLDEKAYTNLIGLYGKAGKRIEASLLFTEMVEKGIKPGMVSYNVMINVFGSGGLYEEAEELFEAMQRDGHSPDSFTYLSLIRAYTESLKYSEAESTIDSMRRRGVVATSAHFNLLLSALAKAGLMKEAERVFGSLVEAGLKPNLACYRSMVRGYLEYGYAEEGIEYFESIRDIVERDRFVMSSGVYFYRSAGMEQKATDILESMSKFGISFLGNLQFGTKLEAT